MLTIVSEGQFDRSCSFPLDQTRVSATTTSSISTGSENSITIMKQTVCVLRDFTINDLLWHKRHPVVSLYIFRCISRADTYFFRRSILSVAVTTIHLGRYSPPRLTLFVCKTWWLSRVSTSPKRISTPSSGDLPRTRSSSSSFSLFLVSLSRRKQLHRYLSDHSGWHSTRACAFHRSAIVPVVVVLDGD